MGKLLKAECSCGYKTSVAVGSGRELHGSVFEFPHLCGKCSETVTADLLQPRVSCPVCNSIDLKIYGTQEHDGAKKKSWFQKLFAGSDEPVPTVVSEYCYNLETTFEIEDRGYFCPKCKEKSLKFSVDAMFD
jgi:Zn finger protein HypA/HybF involved in hydrogenase expression